MINVKNLDIYISRLISALCLFWILAEANVWLNPINNVVLVLGYRLFILFTPFLFLFFRHKLTFAALFLLEIGLGLWLFKFDLLGTVFFAIGISTSGYMLKYYSSFSTRGAAGNKIALNLGSILSGTMVALSLGQNFTLITCIFLMFLSLIAFTKYFNRENIANFPTTKSHFEFKGIFSIKGLAWAIIGFVIGVKLISIVSILPQFVMQNNHGKLPDWFGLMLILNSVIVVLLQLPIMEKVKNLGRIKAVIPLFVGMLIVLLSSELKIWSFGGALIWTFSLSIVECCISYLDKLSQDDHCLLIKEASVGLGSAATVFAVRFFPPQLGSIYLGTLSIILLLLSIYLLNKSKHSELK